MIGGGARNELLCQLTADVTGREVLAGPVEATALGNVLVQARAAGELGSLADLREVSAAVVRARPLRARRRSLSMLDLSKLVIETPSWGYGDSGTRFGVFPQPGRPRDVYEKLDDAAEVHRLTGTAPAGRAATSRGTRSTTTTRCARRSSRAGCSVGAVNPNLFQDPDYKLGSVTHPDARGAREGRRAPARVPGDRRPRSGSTAQSLWLADGTNYPGQDDLRERRRRMLDCLGARLRRAARRAGAAGRVQVLRARLLRDRPRRLGLARC